MHRIESKVTSCKIFKNALIYNENICGNIRIRTHECNLIMWKLIRKNRFQMCIQYVWKNHQKLIIRSMKKNSSKKFIKLLILINLKIIIKVFK